MIDGQGFLITNREIVSQDIDDFEYTPRPEYDGPFTIFNEPNEKAAIERFFEHICISKPNVIVTYNGDFFDWPFVEARAIVNGIDMMKEIGFSKDDQDEYKSRHCIHMDAFRWVKRDSYLPQGSQGLKAVTTAKLGYDPIELDPELMTIYASEKPQILAQYSVSDAVATYYLYMKYVHPFIFSLCNIIPLNPDEVLRKGSGTLCEVLLMLEAYNGSIIMPNKHGEKFGSTYEGHVLESETYVGGHVEALEAGVFRSDIATNFKIIPSAIQTLIDQLDAALKFSIIVEGNLDLEDVENYDEVKAEIIGFLKDLRDTPMRNEPPKIYHLDVAAMYPNIILSNRLQPDAIVDEAMCAACDFNRPGKTCDRRMTWSWRGEYFTAEADEVKMIRNALENETFPGKYPTAPRLRFNDLPASRQSTLLQGRLSEYSRKSHGKARETKVVDKEAIVCQRENPFYVNTVRNFRDRRYEYKGLLKTWKKNVDVAVGGSDITQIDEAKKMVVLYDSLQLAHKCILNSFYGYVMRKGARWYSMEMAGVTCLTGAKIIQMARQIVEQIGRPLELDTDGIWCMLPATFPENFAFKLSNGKKFGISYPCTMLNHLVHAQFTNDQYHDLTDPVAHKYKVHSENSIFFEVDGPYRAMILPSSTEEDKLLKKRYAVFNDDGSLAELKGFEVKRRGELKLIKIFQSQIFKVFLEGKTLQECYAAVAKVANRWLDVLHSKGSSLEDEELVELISENRSMSKMLTEYGAQKSTSISTAKRLAEFLGDQMVKDKGLACKFVISAKPFGAPVTERAVPIAIFAAEPSVKKHFLRKWLKDNGLQEFDLRTILDWNYYLERFGSVIQKLITIPAAMQKVSNPVPRVKHPDWLFKRVAAKDDKFKQHRITEMFSAGPVNDENRNPNIPLNDDLEDFGRPKAQSGGPKVAAVSKKVKRKRNGRHNEDNDEVQEVLGPAPDPHTDYQGWIAHQKIKWKQQRKARQRLLRLYGSSTLNNLSKDASSVTGYFRQQSEAMLGQTWEILQLSETASPGEYRLWFIIGNQIQSVKLAVPRRFYVNLKEETRTDLFTERHQVKRVTRALPRSHQLHHLFRLSMSEKTFQDDGSLFSGLLNDSTVEGVYEMQVPLDIRAIIDLGNLCTINREKPEVLGRGFDQGFALDDLRKEPMAHSYLKQPSSLSYIYVHHTEHEGRLVLSLFSTIKKVSHVFIVDGNRANHDLPNIQKLYRDRYADYVAMRAETDDLEEAFEYTDEMEFDLRISPSEQSAMKAASKIISQYNVEKQSPTMVILHSQEDARSLSTKIRALQDLPTLSFPTSAKENKFPPLQWQTYALKYTISHYFHISAWIMERIALARYADIPLCNMGQDPAVFLSDVFFARRLVRNDMLLWWSPGRRPDLGGREDDDNVQTVEEIKKPEINNAGCFSTVCLDLRIMNLAVNSVLESTSIHDLEGSGGSIIGFDNTSHTLDDYSTDKAGPNASDGSTISAQTFMMLKGMLRGWHIEMAQTRNRFAEMMIEHFYRWINCSTSAMYDPILSQFIHSMMKKVIMQLLAEFRRLGSRVIYANFNRIILLTSKPSAGHAYAYANYIVKAIMGKPLFQSIYLDIHKYWEMLLWMDPANHGGIICQDPTKALDQLEPDADAESQAAFGSWNMKLFLPPALQKTFDTFVTNFIQELTRIKWETRQIGPSQAANAPTQAAAENVDPLQIGEQEEEAASAFVERARRLLSHDLSSDLLRVIAHIQHQQRLMAHDPQDRVMLAFPKLPGSHGELKNPALVLVNYLGAVFGLGKDFAQEVRVLKRNLLNLLDVREFSPDAVFKDPCASCRIESVICPMCNSTDNLDLCRDVDLLPEMEVAEGLNRYRHRRWLCRNSECRAEYDRQMIEERLVDIIQARVAEYQLQDLRCSKCKRVKEENHLAYCAACSGKFRTVIDRQSIMQRLQIMQNVAKFYGFNLLQEVVEWLLQQVSTKPM